MPTGAVHKPEGVPQQRFLPTTDQRRDHQGKDPNDRLLDPSDLTLRRPQLDQQPHGDDDAGNRPVTELANRSRHPEGRFEPPDDEDR
jgi:hypothetical protein